MQNKVLLLYIHPITTTTYTIIPSYHHHYIFK